MDGEGVGEREDGEERFFDGNDVLDYPCTRVCEYSPTGVMVMKEKFKRLFPQAWEGNQNGDYNCKIQTIGFPRKKYSREDSEKKPANQFTWNPQTIFSSVEENRRLVLYEGFSAGVCYDVPLVELRGYETQIGDFELRKELITIIQQELRDGYEIVQASSMIRNIDSVYWSFHDLEFFVNTISRSLGRSIILFLFCQPIGSTKKQQEQFAECFDLVEYLFDNVVSGKARTSISGLPSTSRSPVGSTNGSDSSMGSYSGCRCSYFFEPERRKHPSMTLVNCDENGDLQIPDDAKPLQTLECTLLCGCEQVCKNTKNLQNGQRVPLVGVVELGKQGIEVRAGGQIRKGQFIVEVVGVIRMWNEVYQNRPLREGSTLIDSSVESSLSKHIKIGRSPNSVLVHVDSCSGWGRYRLGYFALAEIQKGDVITYRDDSGN